MIKAVFLDRDGTLNLSGIRSGVPVPPKEVHQVTIIDGVSWAIEIFKKKGYLPVIVTNQPDVARGTIKQSIVVEINEFICQSLGIENVYTCFHDDIDECGCRKPKPGLLELAASDLNIDLSKSIIVGDRWKDISAGQAVGCKPFYIESGYAERKPDSPFTSVSSLLMAAFLISEDK
jgi:D-glycero-D-manno-heptose 1,7-bisphosphate phosphatase